MLLRQSAAQSLADIMGQAHVETASPHVELFGLVSNSEMSLVGLLIWHLNPYVPQARRQPEEAVMRVLTAVV